MDLGPAWQNSGESTAYLSMLVTCLLICNNHACTIMSDRKPQTAKTKNGIQDWHLMMFVFTLILVDVIVLTFYTLLEGLVDNFGVLRVPSEENLSSVSGVSWKNH